MGDNSLSDASTNFTPCKPLEPSNSTSVNLAGRPHEQLKRESHPISAEPCVPKLASILERFPPELYLKIIRNMNPAEGILLSLTCKTLWARAILQSTDVLDKLNRCSPLDQNVHFLRMLEKDRSHYVVCTLCLRLHFRHPCEIHLLIQIGPFFEASRPCSKEMGVFKTLGTVRRLHISREGLELVLRAGVLGSDYGLRLECLQRAMDWEVFAEAHLKVHMESAAKIVKVPGPHDSDRHLFLKTAYTVEMDLRRDVFGQIEAAKIGACGHNRRNGEEASHIKQIIRRAVRAPTHSDAVFTAQFSCCPTDMIVQAIYKPTEVFVKVKLAVYRDLGPRGDHNMEIWRRQSGSDLMMTHYDRSMLYPFRN